MTSVENDVNGQQFLRGGGHENCALAAIGTAR
jgi:hypothetical protein